MVSSIVIILLICVAGFNKAIMDALQFHYSTSIFIRFKNQQWWNPSISWKNKYKNGDKKNGPKFFGSTTFLSFITDGWHLSQFIFLSSLQFAILFGINMTTPFQWYYWVAGFIILKVVLGGIFELFYGRLFNL